ncbi:MAG TPA: hypothetical protein VEZ14_00535, partial [Dehalococcoidia bacterium]|nr:hypothetical protein [Dehalococcoidia bacterium]
MLAGVILAVIAIAAAVISVGIFQKERPQPGTPGVTLAGSDATSLRAFTAFPVFWVGEEYGAYKLDRVIGPTPDGWEQPVLITYGTCGPTFERGCVPPIVIKTIPRCWPGVGTPDSSPRIRGRAVSDLPHLTIEVGYGTVVIYADKDTSMAIARDLIVANTGAFPQYVQIKPGEPLPGSLCELARLHPRTYPTPATPDSFTPNARVATVFAALGSTPLISTYAEAQERLGWNPLRNDDPRFTVAQEGAIGALRTLKNRLPSFEQMYQMVDRGPPIMIRQEPESDPDFPREHVTKERLGPWDVELYSDYGDVGAVFYSGASVDGQRIRVVAYAPAEYGYTLDDIREFVGTLSVGNAVLTSAAS